MIIWVLNFKSGADNLALPLNSWDTELDVGNIFQKYSLWFEDKRA